MPRLASIDRCAMRMGLDHPVVEALRQLAQLATGGGSSAAASIVVWKPAGPAAPGVYTTSAAAWAAAAAIPGRVIVQIDSTVPVTFDAVTHDCFGRISCASVLDQGTPLQADMPENAILRNPENIAGVYLRTQGALTENIVFDLAEQAIFYMSHAAQIASVSALRSIRQDKAMIYELEQGSVLGRSTIRCNGFTPTIRMYTQSALQANTIDNTAAAYVVERDASATFATPQGPAMVTDTMVDKPTNIPFDGTAATPVKMRTVATAFDAIEEASGPLEIRGYIAHPLTGITEQTTAAIGSNYEGGLFLLTRPNRCNRVRVYLPVVTPGATLSFAIYQNDGTELGTTNDAPWALISSGTSAALPAGPITLNQLLTASGVSYQGNNTLTAGVYALLWGVDAGGPITGQVFDNTILELANADVPVAKPVLTFTTIYPANAPPPPTLDINQGSADIAAATTAIAPIHILSAG